MNKDEQQSWVWLEVSEVRYESGQEKICSVLLRADREQPKPVWWPVEDTAVSTTALETYKAILSEMDKKRMVLARLASSARQKNGKVDAWLRCDAFRFQSPELGSR